ncbi:MAG: peptidylprolyl isomerase [Proteobacteria bacterium]|nr:peptidylprolyl isomerase [Pseudomonadota bacterium]
MSVRSPALHFALLGALLFAASRLLFADPDGRAGAARQLQPLPPLAGASDEELLFREALALGMHESDSLVRRRLIQNMRFVAGSAAQTADDELFREALALGMHQTDLVVRRRLIQKMALLAASEGRGREPGDHELQAFLTEHAARFARPEAVRLSQVFLSRERRGEALADDAKALLAALRADPGVELSGDPLPHPRDLPLRTREQLAKSFGPEFARAVFALPADGHGWQGPILSSYGLHGVRIHERQPARPARLAEVRGAVREALFEARAREALDRRLAALRARGGEEEETD